MKITVSIEEHISQKFEIEAEDIGDALKKAEQMYYNEELVVDSFNAPTCKLMMADDGEMTTEWVEF